jgi:hypothetical protein
VVVVEAEEEVLEPAEHPAGLSHLPQNSFSVAQEVCQILPRQQRNARLSRIIERQVHIHYRETHQRKIPK